MPSCSGFCYIDVANITKKLQKTKVVKAKRAIFNALALFLTYIRKIRCKELTFSTFHAFVAFSTEPRQENAP